MKRSKAVPATLVGTIAAATITGCNNTPSQTRDCVDQNGRVLSDSACEQAEQERRTRRSGTSTHAYPHFIYGGNYNRSSGVVSGGSTTASPNSNIVTRGGSVVRGGFGSSGSGRGGFFSFGS